MEVVEPHRNLITVDCSFCHSYGKFVQDHRQLMIVVYGRIEGAGNYVKTQHVFL
jgi:hypothetical protein